MDSVQIQIRWLIVPIGSGCPCEKENNCYLNLSVISTNTGKTLTWHTCILSGLSSFSKVLKQLTLNAQIATKVVCFSHMLKCLRSLYGKQCGPRSDCSYTLFPFIPNWSVMLGNYLQQMTSADNIFRCIFFLGALRVKTIKHGAELMPDIL